ncbi:taste receptor type 2 member 7-like [Anomaloglossus baeobatrachus]|uniref:taste receptor type 2 member 7-like n=1 Tax=Anomaloglossus baeobatrachus TaxID=238106 RepID=UPI003F4FBE73
MSGSTEDDAPLQYLDLVVLAAIALVAGIMIHSFIIGVNVNDWWKGRSMTSVDHIVTSLGISRMCAQCPGILFLFLATFFPSSLDSHVTVGIIDAVYAFFIHSNIWLTSLLSIVFCLKISNLRTRLFLYLRGMILPRTGHFIVASVFLSAVSCSIPLWKTFDNVTSDGTYNKTMDDLSFDCTSINFIVNFLTGVLFPLLFYYISSVLLFSSLYHHTVKMKKSSNLSINLETYYSAMKFVSFTLIYKTTYFIGHFLCVIYYYFYCETIQWLYIFSDFLPVLHSFYLVYRTARLRSQMSKVLHSVIGFFF